MKKKIVFILASLLLLTACGADTNVNFEKVYGIKGEHAFLIESDYDKLITKVADEEAGIYYFASPSCEPCKILTPIINEALKENDAKAYYINVDSKKFEEDHKALLMFLGEMEKEENEYAGAVPSLYVLNDIGSVFGSSDIVPSLMEYMQTEDEKALEFIKIRINALIKNYK